MKQYTHAWLAMMAIKRLEKASIPKSYHKSAEGLVKWFKNHRDFVVQGAWYPDAVIKDMGTSHILKYEPGDMQVQKVFKKLPTTFHLYGIGKSSPLYKKDFKVEKGNLPDRCESLAHSIVDNFKMQECEDKGSPISPTDNHIATIFFMLSHYIADAHMPLHCDVRQFSAGDKIHAKIEEEWDDEMKRCFKIDKENERFIYETDTYPQKIASSPIFDWIEDQLSERTFNTGFGTGNNNVWDFMSAITQYSYLTAYKMIPANYTHENLEWEDFISLDTGYSFDEYSKYLLMDSIDSIAKIWLRVWNKYQKWYRKYSKSH